jgi:hypothetical protein
MKTLADHFVRKTGGDISTLQLQSQSFAPMK